MNIGDEVELEGWLVIIDYKPFLITGDCSENYENYENYEKVEIENPEIIFCVIDRILPLGGGKSFIFHRSKVLGVLTEFTPMKIKPTALSVEERGGGFISIDIEGNIEKYKAQYSDYVKSRSTIKSGDWIDHL